MSEHGLDADSFLTELDGRLRSIQAELRPGVAVPTLSVLAMEREPRSEGEPPAERRGRSGPLSALLGRARLDPGPGDADPREREADPPSPETAELLAQVKVLTETQRRLIAVSERLLEAFARMIESPPSLPRLFTPTTAAPGRAGVEIAAGPFADTGALRQFKRALEQLDAVRRVTVRGYQGTDRAILDVELVP